MHVSALLSSWACRPKVATPLLPLDEKPQGLAEYFPRAVSHLQRKVARTLVRKPAQGFCLNLVGFCGESNGAWEVEPL